MTAKEGEDTCNYILRVELERKKLKVDAEATFPLLHTSTPVANEGEAGNAQGCEVVNVGDIFRMG